MSEEISNKKFKQLLCLKEPLLIVKDDNTAELCGSEVINKVTNFGQFSIMVGAACSKMKKDPMKVWFECVKLNLQIRDSSSSLLSVYNSLASTKHEGNFVMN